MTVTARSDTRRRAARVVTEASAPAVSLAILLPLVGWHSAGATVNGLLLGLAGTVFAAVVPMTYIVANVRRGRLTDHHVGVREQRRTPLLVGLASVLVGSVVLILLGAGREMVALMVAGTSGLVVSIVVSHWWKMSLHTAVAAGSVIILALVFGPWLLLATLLLVPIGWSRVVLADHTVPQVVGGALIGGTVAAIVFSAIA